MRITSLSSLLLAFLALAMFVSTGCDTPKGDQAANGGNHAGDDHDHDDHAGHGHDDHPAHGPFGGHLIEIDTTDHQVEWKKYKDNDVIRMYILDADAKKEAPLKVDSFVVKSDVGSEASTFTLEPEEPNDEGATAVFMLDDKDLSIAIPLGVTIEIKMGDKVYNGKIKAHKPLDH